MIGLQAEQIAAILDAEIIDGPPAAIAKSVSIDSRKIAGGDCFVAIVGDRLDGHDYAAAAADAGASVLIVDRPVEAASAAVVRVADTTRALQHLGEWLRHKLDPRVVGITGSLGKTTTKELTASLLGGRYSVHATPGNLNNHWGLPLSLLGLEPGHDVMVAEMAMSRAGEIAALARLADPDVGVITNIAPAHMENFADLDAVADAKGELAQQLPASGTLIVNADDPLTDALPARLAPHVARVLRFGRSERADMRAEKLAGDGSGWSFDLVAGDQRHAVALPLAGMPAVSCFLAAAATAWALDVPVDEIAGRAADLEPLPNRGGVRRIDGITLLDESYNASPLAVDAALETLAALAGGRRVAVLGDMREMGEWTDRVHRDAGARAVECGVGLLVAVGASASLVVEGAVGAGMTDEATRAFETADEAAGWLPSHLQPGDAVLVKGSRAVQLERVVDAVAESATVSNGVVES